MDRQGSRDSLKRRIFFIEKDFQAKFMLKFLALVAAAGFVTTCALYFLTMQSSTVYFVNSRAVVQTTARFLLPLLVQTVLAVTVVTSIAALAVTLFVSHKIAGPIYRLKKVMKEVGDGDLSGEFRIRQKDQLQDLAGSFSDMILKTREKLSELREKADIIKGKLDGISEHDVSEQKRPDLNELKKHSAELNRITHSFRL